MDKMNTTLWPTISPQELSQEAYSQLFNDTTCKAVECEQMAACVAEPQSQSLTSINKANFSAFWERSSLEFQTNET
jgi:ethanolamine utilization protein EutQ (cupin superfamily)